MNKLSEMLSSSKSKKMMHGIIVVLVLGIVSVSIYLVYKRASEHFAPTGDCLQALQSYKNYKCAAGSALTDKNEVELLRQVVNKCPEGTRLDNFVCPPFGSDIEGGIQEGNRAPSFFPSADWANSVKGTNPTRWGSYTYPGQK